MDASGVWYRVATCGDVPPGEMVGVDPGGVQVALYNVDGHYFATSNVCTHAWRP